MSGSASRGTVRIDHSPPITAAATAMKTIILFRAESSMMALITASWPPALSSALSSYQACRPSPSHRTLPGAPSAKSDAKLIRRAGHAGHSGHPAHAQRGGLHLAFGIDQEVTRSDHTLASGEARQNLYAVTLALAGLYLPRFEVAVAAIDKDRLTIARVEHGVRRYRQFRRNVHQEFDVGVHVRLEQHAGVIHIEPHLESPGHRIDLRLEKIDPGVEDPSRNCLDRYTGRLA